MKIVPYYRVRLKEPDATAKVPKPQKSAVSDFSESNRGNVVKSFTEVEIGKMADRLKLRDAIAIAQENKAKLVIADPYRVSQDLVFLGILRDTAVDFVCLGDSNVTPKTVGILANVEASSRQQISRITKDVLAQAKAEGKKLGSARPGHWKGREHLRGYKKGAENSAKARTKRAQAAYGPVILPKILELREKGLSDESIAAILNQDGHTTTAGKPFSLVAVYRIRKRHEEEVAA